MCVFVRACAHPGSWSRQRSRRNHWRHRRSTRRGCTARWSCSWWNLFLSLPACKSESSRCGLNTKHRSTTRHNATALCVSVCFNCDRGLTAVFFVRGVGAVNDLVAPRWAGHTAPVFARRFWWAARDIYGRRLAFQRDTGTKAALTDRRMQLVTILGLQHLCRWSANSYLNAMTLCVLQFSSFPMSISFFCIHQSAIFCYFDYVKKFLFHVPWKENADEGTTSSQVNSGPHSL